MNGRLAGIPRWFPWLLIGGGVAVLVGLGAGWIGTRKPTRDGLFVLAGLDVFVYVWTRVGSGRSFRTQVVMLVAVFAPQVLAVGLLRVDGFAGDGRPRFVWRWTPTAQETFERSRQPRSPVTPVLDLSVGEHDWPGYRGADRLGHAGGDDLRLEQPPRLVWRRAIGKGWSSWAIAGEGCFTQEQRGEMECVVAYELRTGREVWVYAQRTRFYEPTGDEGPRATPTIAGGRVFALGATGILNCLEAATGKLVWAVHILRDNGTENALFGMTGSPLVTDGLVVVSPGGTGRSVVAYDAESGERRWSGGDAAASYSSPQLAELGGVRQVLSFNAEGLTAHDLADGRVHWHWPWVSNPAERNNVGQPIPLPGFEGGDCVFLASGYGMGSTLLQVDREGSLFTVRPRWRSRHMQAKFSSVVVRDGLAFGLDRAHLAGLDLRTGERRWTAGRYGYGQLLLAGRRLLVQTESGDVAVVDPTAATPREVCHFPALDGRTWNVPALAGPWLLVRNDREAACFVWE